MQPTHRLKVLSPHFLILCTAVGLLCAVAALGLKFFREVDLPYRSPGAPLVVTIPKGTGAGQIARLLNRQGVLPSHRHFLFAAWQDAVAKKLQAGEYDSSVARSPRQWVGLLRDGRRVRYRVTIPEGWNITEIAARFQSLSLLSSEDFLAAASGSLLLKKYSLPASTPEGYLFPETYLFEKPLSATAALEAFFKEFSRQSQALGGLTHQQVILASLIEKEAQKPEDMRKVSVVFQNRLNNNLALQSDATVLYALQRDGRAWEPLDTSYPSRYNTYRQAGLPPEPICNPGRNALAAAVHPATGDWLYFQSDSEGIFYFSKTLREHSRRKKMIGEKKANHR